MELWLRLFLRLYQLSKSYTMVRLSSVSHCLTGAEMVFSIDIKEMHATGRLSILLEGKGGDQWI